MAVAAAGSQVATSGPDPSTPASTGGQAAQGVDVSSQGLVDSFAEALRATSSAQAGEAAADPAAAGSEGGDTTGFDDAAIDAIASGGDVPERLTHGFVMTPSEVRGKLAGLDSSDRNEMVRAYLLAQAYASTGMRLGDVKAIQRIAPDAATFNTIVTDAQNYGGLVQAVANGDVGPIVRLVSGNPAAVRSLVGGVVRNIERLDKQAYDSIGARAISDLFEYLGSKGDPTLDAALEDIRRAFAGGGEEKKVDPMVADLKRRLDEAEQRSQQQRIDAEQARRQELMGQIQTFHQNVMAEAMEVGAREIGQWLGAQMPGSTPEQVKAALDLIGPQVVSEIENNPAMAATYNQMLYGGGGDDSHKQRLVEYLTRAAKTAAARLAAPVIRIRANVPRPASTPQTPPKPGISQGGAPGGAGGTAITGKGRSVDATFNDVVAFLR